MFILFQVCTSDPCSGLSECEEYSFCNWETPQCYNSSQVQNECTQIVTDDMTFDENLCNNSNRCRCVANGTMCPEETYYYQPGQNNLSQRCVSNCYETSKQNKTYTNYLNSAICEAIGGPKKLNRYCDGTCRSREHTHVRHTPDNNIPKMKLTCTSGCDKGEIEVSGQDVYMYNPGTDDAKIEYYNIGNYNICTPSCYSLNTSIEMHNDELSPGKPVAHGYNFVGRYQMRNGTCVDKQDCLYRNYTELGDAQDSAQNDNSSLFICEEKGSEHCLFVAPIAVEDPDVNIQYHQCIDEATCEGYKYKMVDKQNITQCFNNCRDFKKEKFYGLDEENKTRCVEECSFLIVNLSNSIEYHCTDDSPDSGYYYGDANLLKELQVLKIVNGHIYSSNCTETNDLVNHLNEDDQAKNNISMPVADMGPECVDVAKCEEQWYLDFATKSLCIGCNSYDQPPYDAYNVLIPADDGTTYCGFRDDCEGILIDDDDAGFAECKLCTNQYINGNQCVDVCPNKTSVDGKHCVDNCDEGQFANGSVCVPSCGDWYENGTQCVQECSDYIDGKKCVSSCGGRYIHNKECVDQCETPFVNGSMCQETCDRFIDGKSCVDVCPTHQYKEENICGVCNDMYYVDKTIHETMKRCATKDECVINSDWGCQRACEQYIQADACVEGCSGDYFFPQDAQSKVCDNECLTYIVEGGSNRCGVASANTLLSYENKNTPDGEKRYQVVSTRPDNCAYYEVLDLHGLTKQHVCTDSCTKYINDEEHILQVPLCAEACPASLQYIETNRHCAGGCQSQRANVPDMTCLAEGSRCPHQSYQEDGLYHCLGEGVPCPSGKACSPDCDGESFIEEGRCVGACSSKYYRGKQCLAQDEVEHCQAYLQRGEQNECVEQCPRTHRFQIGRMCVESCGDLFSNGDQCVDNCGSLLVDMVDKQCVSSCGSGKYQNGSSCVQSCGGWFIDGNECVETCSTEYVNGTLCVDSCGADQYVNGRQCVSRCDDEQYVSGRQCVTGCQDGQFISGRECVAECGSDKLIDDGRCVASCDSGYFNENGVCVERCSSEDKKVLYDGREDKQCMQTCPQNTSLLTDDNTCYETCPSGYQSTDGLCVKTVNKSAPIYGLAVGIGVPVVVSAATAVGVVTKKKRARRLRQALIRKRYREGTGSPSAHRCPAPARKGAPARKKTAGQRVVASGSTRVHSKHLAQGGAAKPGAQRHGAPVRASGQRAQTQSKASARSTYLSTTESRTNSTKGPAKAAAKKRRRVEIE